MWRMHFSIYCHHHNNNNNNNNNNDNNNKYNNNDNDNDNDNNNNNNSDDQEPIVMGSFNDTLQHCCQQLPNILLYCYYILIRARDNYPK